MDSNGLLLTLAGISSLLLLVRAIRSRARGWIVVGVVLVGVAGAGYVAFRSVAGYAAGAAWAALVLAPSLGQALVGRLGNRQRYGAAARLAGVIRWLHPADGWWDRPLLLRALHLAQQGNIAEATVALTQLEASSKAFAQEARVHLLRMTSRWDEVLAWLRSVPAGELQKNTALLLLFLRALGETGHLEELVLRYAFAEPTLGNTAGALHVARLFVFAFAGRTERVEGLFHGPLSDYTPPLQAFWTGTATLAAGGGEPARERLRALLTQPDAGLRVSVERRLARSLADPRELGLEARAALAQLERERDLEERYGASAERGGRPWATLGLMALLTLVFAVEVGLGGLDALWGEGTAERTLKQLGALQPDRVLLGEWWRVPAATLLHAGWLHFAMNLAGLYVLGPYVEYALGRARYLVVYVVSGVGMMGIVVLLAHFWDRFNEPLVGASGSIMGLIGATGAVLLRGRRREGSAIAGQRLRWVGFVVALQAVFDVLTPQVSFTSHLGGAVLGFAAAALMGHRVTPPPRR